MKPRNGARWSNSRASRWISYCLSGATVHPAVIARVKCLARQRRGYTLRLRFQISNSQSVIASASEAIHKATGKQEWIASSLALLAMTPRYTSAISPHVFARVMPEASRPRNQRAQGMPGARCARSLACKSRKHASKSPRSHRKHPAFPAQWF
jgi:hypothetical protein